VIREKCGSCSGAGKIPETVELDVKIPAGIDTGMTLRLTGEGESGLNGGPRGDLYVEIEVREHHLFQREGKHLICDVPLSYTQAVLGADIDIPCLEGTTKHHIYPGTQPGELLRIRGGGMPDPRGGTPGDLVLHVILEVPKKITAEQEAILRELAHLERAEVSPHRKSFFAKMKDWFVPPEEFEEEVQ
jgi:molecular chaperone DnaJ